VVAVSRLTIAVIGVLGFTPQATLGNTSSRLIEVVLRSSALHSESSFILPWAVRHREFEST
jgi:hypothetical protein